MEVCVATATGKRFAHRMLDLHRIVKSNNVAGLLRHTPTAELPQPPPMIRLLDSSSDKTTTLVVDVDRLLLRKSSTVKVAAGSQYFAGVMEEDGETTDIERLRALLKQTEKNACVRS